MNNFSCKCQWAVCLPKGLVFLIFASPDKKGLPSCSNWTLTLGRQCRVLWCRWWLKRHPSSLNVKNAHKKSQECCFPSELNYALRLQGQTEGRNLMFTIGLKSTYSRASSEWATLEHSDLPHSFPCSFEYSNVFEYGEKLCASQGQHEQYWSKIYQHLAEIWPKM